MTILSTLHRVRFWGTVSLLSVLPLTAANAHGQRITSIKNDELAEHRLTSRAIIHRPMPSGFTSLQVWMHVVVNTSGQVESAKVWNLDRAADRWARDQAEAAEQSQRFLPFKRYGHLVRASFDDDVWIVPPVEWAGTHIPFPEISNWDTLRIQLKRTSCYGMCPVYSIELRGDGRVVFDGESNVPAIGHFRSRVPRETLARLVASFRRADYFSLKDEYVAMITDNPTCITSMQFDGFTKSVKDYVGVAAGMPEVVVQVERDIDGIAREKGWIH